MPESTIKILIVDDSMFMRHIIRNHLLKMGYPNVSEAADGRGALAVMRRQEIDIVISDWCMPGMHGIDLLKAIRADQTLHNTPFIMLTAEAQPHLVKDALAAKVSAYITKPFTSADLREELDRVTLISGKQKIDNPPQFI